MNTGLRRGEVVKLRWGSVDFNRRLLTVEGRNAKNRQTRHVPLMRRLREPPDIRVYGEQPQRTFRDAIQDHWLSVP
jgi:integrase